MYILSNFTRRKCKEKIEITIEYWEKMKEVMKAIFLVNEQNVPVIYIDISAISCIDFFQQDECFCSNNLELGSRTCYVQSKNIKMLQI